LVSLPYYLSVAKTSNKCLSKTAQQKTGSTGATEKANTRENQTKKKKPRQTLPHQLTPKGE
jgi:hypothetical protein